MAYLKKETYPKAGGGHILGICAPVPLGITPPLNRASRRPNDAAGDVFVQSFFERPILNSPYAYPDRHWELDVDGQPTNQILPKRRKSELLTPVPKPEKRLRDANQPGLMFDSGHGLSTHEQEYTPTRIISEIRRDVEDCRKLPNPDQWEDYACVGHTDNADNVRAPTLARARSA
jgi:hypothetical protein